MIIYVLLLWMKQFLGDFRNELSKGSLMYFKAMLGSWKMLGKKEKK